MSTWQVAALLLVGIRVLLSNLATTEVSPRYSPECAPIPVSGCRILRVAVAWGRKMVIPARWGFGRTGVGCKM